MRSLLVMMIFIAALAGCQSAPEPVDTPAMRAAKAVALAASAKEAYDNREFTLAIEKARSGVHLDDASLDSWYWLGAALFATNQEEEAGKTIKRFIELAGQQPDRQGQVGQAYDRLGWMSFRRGRMDDAARFFSLALERSPLLVHALDGRGQASYLRKDYDAAIRDLSKALELGSTVRHTAVEYRGLAYYWTGNFAKALPDLKAALEYTGADRKTDRKELIRAMALCHLGMGDPQTATSVFTRAKEFNDEEKRYNVAAIIYVGGDKELALRQAGKRTGIGLKETRQGAASSIFVDRVAPGSPADKAGIRLGDEVTMVNGVPVATVEQYREVMRAVSLGNTARLSIVRSAVKRDIGLVMGDAEYVLKADPYLAPLLSRPVKSKK